jgi:zinc/manganese transport system substrate-binding protein
LRASLTLLLFLLLPSPAEASPTIVVSFSVLADLTRNVAGSEAHIIMLVGPDSDIHAYEPAPADIRAVAGADLFIANGLGLEGWMDRLLEASSFKGTLVVASAGVTPLMVGGAPDPHAWQDVANAERYVAVIRAALMKADPPHAASYNANAARYLKKLEALDVWVRAQVALVPPAKRQAISSHDALGYFAHAYSVRFFAPLGLSTEGDVSAGTLAGLIDQIRAKNIHAVFLENMSDPRIVQQLARDGGAVIGGTLYSDALSPSQGPAPSYITMICHNVTALVDAMRQN